MNVADAPAARLAMRVADDVAAVARVNAVPLLCDCTPKVVGRRERVAQRDILSGARFPCW